MNLAPKLPPHRPIREKYNPVMNAAERRHAERVCEEPCFGCRGPGGVAHHTLLNFPGKRWRRDHRRLLPVCHECHTDIHDTYGNEEDWLSSLGRTVGAAVAEMERLWAVSEELER